MIEVNKIANENGVAWFELVGTDYGTAVTFDNETIGLTDGGRILDSDGIPCTPGDRYEIAARNALGV